MPLRLYRFVITERAGLSSPATARESPQREISSSFDALRHRISISQRDDTGRASQAPQIQFQLQYFTVTLSRNFSCLWLSRWRWRRVEHFFLPGRFPQLMDYLLWSVWAFFHHPRPYISSWGPLVKYELLLPVIYRFLAHSSHDDDLFHGDLVS